MLLAALDQTSGDRADHGCRHSGSPAVKRGCCECWSPLGRTGASRWGDNRDRYGRRRRVDPAHADGSLSKAFRNSGPAAFRWS